MLAFLRRFARVLLLVLGFVLVALLIWYAGPLFEFAEYRPLDSPAARLYVIAAVIGGWLLYRLVKRLRAFAVSDRLVAAVLKQAVPEKAQPSAEALKLRERFEEAVSTLKQKRRSGHSLYELPWYVIIGAPGSGKTTALVHSGLKFPLETRGGRALKGVGGTRNCDWWFADEAVFLDTAGRYTTQDSDATSDSAAWSEFLTLLRKYRKRRPINGVILTISAHDLIVQSDAKREEHVEAARNRLIELNRELRIQLPVYLMVTKCDLVAGFAEYFDDLSHEGRAQVWGVTFPYEETRTGDAAEAFPAEFDALIERLNERVAARVEEDRDVRRRTRVFAFPQQMAALREPLAAFVTDVFATTRFEQQVLLRGVYLTSGTQEGTPIDRLLGAIGRGFGLSADVVAPAAGRGKAYFVERFLKDVMIGESGLAGSDRRGEVAKAAVHLGAYAAVALIAALGVVALTVSHQRNQAYLGRLATDLATFQKVPAVTAAAPPERLLQRLNAVRTLAESANQYRSDVPWQMQWGLYQGNALGDSARDAYMRELDSLLLPHVLARFKQRVVERRADPEKVYEPLKAYLMLNDPAHLDPQFLGERADLEWGPPAGVAGNNAPTLATHFKSRLADGGGLPPLPLDVALIAQARQTIQQASVAGIIYREIQRQSAEDTTRTVSLAQPGIGGVDLIRRKSGISLAQPLPAIYSKAVFNDVTDTGSRLGLVKKFAADDWVVGDRDTSYADAAKLTNEVITLYERDYIDAWDRVLADLELAPVRSADDIGPVLELLGGPGSPLRRLVAIVVDNTKFTSTTPPPPTPGAIATAGRNIKEQLGKLQKAAGIATITPGRLITAHFQPYHRLMEGEPGQTPIDRVITLIAQVRSAWDAVAAAGDISKASTDPAIRESLALLRQQSQTLPRALHSLVERIWTGTSTTIDVATKEVEQKTKEIEQKTVAILEQAAVQAAVERDNTINTLFRQQVLPECNRIVAGRYPFTQGSDRDMPLIDFATLFGNNGVFDNFFRTHLAALAETSSKPWRWIPGTDTRLSTDILRVFQNAADVREVFFHGDAKLPSMQFAAMLLDHDQAATRFQLDIEGAVLDSQQPRRFYTIKWPGSRASFVQASFDGRYSIPYKEEFHGPWAWFRLLERSKMTRESDIRNVLTVTVKGLHANIALEAVTVHNPFASGEWQRFTCGGS